MRKAKRRVDWSSVPAPKAGTKARARYERSAVYARRVEAAARGLETRARNEAAAKRERARLARIESERERLRPLLEVIVRQEKRGQQDMVTRRARGVFTKGPRKGQARTKEVWASHAKWYREKMKAKEKLGKGAYLAMLETLAEEAGTGDLDWDIVY